MTTPTLSWLEGLPVYWYDAPRGGYGPSRPVLATVITTSAKRLTLAAELARGGTKVVRVPASRVQLRAYSVAPLSPSQERALQTAIDALEEEVSA